MKIDTVARLKVHLKVLKMKLLNEGFDKLQLYPMFCHYYNERKERYSIPKEIIFETASEILIEEA